MTKTVLHLLSQRPGRTGSGVTLNALARCAATAGWEQHAVVGTPADDPEPAVDSLPPDHVHPLVFGEPPVPFPLPGMSDVMPYESSRFSELGEPDVNTYKLAWRSHLAVLVERVRPDVIHAHHLWILASILKDFVPGVPVVNHVHGTGLRQMEICSHLSGSVRAGCARNDRFAVLHDEQAARVGPMLGVPEERIAVVGAGYRQDLFHARGRSGDDGERLVYVGKLAFAKGVPQLLDAFVRLAQRRPRAELHLVGGGGGEEAEALRQRAERLDGVHLHGPLSQEELADLLRTGRACVLPSYFEGLPLVLAEALACGCRLVATRLPGIESAFEPRFGPALELVEPPDMESVDTPVPASLHAFAERLEGAMERALDADPLGDPQSALPGALEPLTWEAVFGRVERLWLELAGDEAGGD